MVTHMSRKRCSKRYSKHSKTHIKRNMYRKKHKKTHKKTPRGGGVFPSLTAANHPRKGYFGPPKVSIPVPIQYLPGWKVIYDEYGDPSLISPSGISYKPNDNAVLKIALKNYELSQKHSEVPPKLPTPHESPAPHKSPTSPKSPKPRKSKSS